jgi:chaperonin GroES
MTQIVPIRDNIVVQKIEDEAKTKSGLVLPDDAKERPTTGTVIAIGPGKTNDEGVLLPMTVKAGDVILFPKYSGHPAKIDAEEFLILEEKEVLAILK